MIHPTLVILAAGLAVRFGGSKQIQAVGPSGEAIMDYSIFDATRVGFKDVVLIVNHAFPDQLRDKIAERWKTRIGIRFIVQPADGISRSGIAYSRAKPWGTGHALLVALPEVRGSFAVINADDYYGSGSFSQLMTFLSSPDKPECCDCCMIGFRLEDSLSSFGSVSRGICHSVDGVLTSIQEFREIRRDGHSLWGVNEEGQRTQLPGTELVSMNIWGFRANPRDHFVRLFDDFIRTNGQDANKEFYLPGAINGLIAEQALRVKVIPTTDRWFGLTYTEDLAWAQSCIAEQIRNGCYPGDLFRS